MQTRVNPNTQRDGNIDTDNLVPSFPGPDRIAGRAQPPRRIVQVARRFGESGIVQSICQDDFERPLIAIADLIGRGMARSACDAGPERSE